MLAIRELKRWPKWHPTVGVVIVAAKHAVVASVDLVSAASETSIRTTEPASTFIIVGRTKTKMMVWMIKSNFIG